MPIMCLNGIKSRINCRKVLVYQTLFVSLHHATSNFNLYLSFSSGKAICEDAFLFLCSFLTYHRQEIRKFDFLLWSLSIGSC